MDEKNSNGGLRPLEKIKALRTCVIKIFKANFFNKCLLSVARFKTVKIIVQKGKRLFHGKQKSLLNSYKEKETPLFSQLPLKRKKTL